MSDRVRLTVDVPDRIRRALSIHAARKGITLAEIIERLVTENFPEDLANADESMTEGEPPRKKRPRKPRPPGG